MAALTYYWVGSTAASINSFNWDVSGNWRTLKIATGGSGGTSGTWAGLTTGAYTIYGNQLSTEANATNYGFLYNWYAATDSRKICTNSYGSRC